MKVKRIVYKIESDNQSVAKRFYHDVLGLEVLMDMDMDWIVTYGSSI